MTYSPAAGISYSYKEGQKLIADCLVEFQRPAKQIGLGLYIGCGIVSGEEVTGLVAGCFRTNDGFFPIVTGKFFNQFELGTWGCHEMNLVGPKSQVRVEGSVSTDMTNCSVSCYYEDTKATAASRTFSVLKVSSKY